MITQSSAIELLGCAVLDADDPTRLRFDYLKQPGTVTPTDDMIDYFLQFGLDFRNDEWAKTYLTPLLYDVPNPAAVEQIPENERAFYISNHASASIIKRVLEETSGTTFEKVREEKNAMRERVRNLAAAQRSTGR